MLARVQEIQALLPPDVRRGLRVDPSERARPSTPLDVELAASRSVRAPGRLEAQSLDGLDVQGLLRLRRALATTTPGARVEAIAHRVREIDALLGHGVTVRDYGLLRASVRQVEDWTWELGLASLDWRERLHLQRVIVFAWRRGANITNRICSGTQYEPARQHAIEAWRALERCAIERIRACLHPGSGMPLELLQRELAAWRTAYEQIEVPWPIEPTDAELEARERSRVATTEELASLVARRNYCPAEIPRA
jgi:hypothetical protein